jgi:hypothetical protein
LVAASIVARARVWPESESLRGRGVRDRGSLRVAAVAADGHPGADVAVGSAAGRPARVRLYPGTVFAGGGEPPATDLDVLGGAVPADGVYVG